MGSTICPRATDVAEFQQTVRPQITTPRISRPRSESQDCESSAHASSRRDALDSQTPHRCRERSHAIADLGSPPRRRPLMNLAA